MQTIQVPKLSTIHMWSKLKLANRIPLIRIPKEKAFLIKIQWTGNQQPELKTLVERFTLWRASVAGRIQTWQLACCSWVLGDTEDRNDSSGQWYDSWPLDTWEDCVILWWLRDAILPMVVKEPAEYPEPDQDDASGETLLPDQERNDTALPSAPPLQKAVLLCPLPGQVDYFKWWLMKYFADHMDIFHMYAEMGNNEHTEILHKFQDSQNPTVFVTTATVGGIGLNLTVAMHAVMTQKRWVLNEQWQAFAQVVKLGQNRVPHKWLLNTERGGYDNHASNLDQHNGVTHMRVLHGLMSRPSIMRSMIKCILESLKDYMKPLTANRNTLRSDQPLS